jgi:hypothetical protein
MPLQDGELVEILSIIRFYIFAVQLWVFLFILIDFLVKVENCNNLQEPEGNDYGIGHKFSE